MVGTRVGGLHESDADVSRDAYDMGSRRVAQLINGEPHDVHADGEKSKKMKIGEDKCLWNALNRVLSQSDLMAFDDEGDELVRQLLTSPSGGLGRVDDGFLGDGNYEMPESFNDCFDGHTGDEEDALLQMMMHQAGIGATNGLSNDNRNALKRMRSISAFMDDPTIMMTENVLLNGRENNLTSPFEYAQHDGMRIEGKTSNSPNTKSGVEMDGRDVSDDSSTGNCTIENIHSRDQSHQVPGLPKSAFGEEVDPRLYKLASLAGYLRSMLQSTYSSRHVASGVPCISTKSIQACMMSCQDDADELEQCFSINS